MQSDNEFESIISIVKSLKGDDEDLGIWEGSPFAWIKREPSRRVGKIGEQIVSAWCIQKGFVISKSHDSDADIVVNDRPIEIKFSTLWQSNRYTFQKLRDQNYEYAFFLGLSPYAVHGWFVSKSVLRKYVIGHTPQHTGKKGSDTFWISFNVNSPPVWLNEFGGTMSQVYQVMKREIGNW